jgi:hypothetical protein
MRNQRNGSQVRKSQFIQVAAMAVKGLQSMDNFTGGKV